MSAWAFKEDYDEYANATTFSCTNPFECAHESLVPVARQAAKAQSVLWVPTAYVVDEKQEYLNYAILHVYLKVCIRSLDLRCSCMNICMRSQYPIMNELHVRIQRGGGGTGVRTPLKITKIKGFLEIFAWIPWKSQSCQSAFNVGPSSARLRNAIYMAFRWNVDDGPLIVVIVWFGSSLPSKNTRQTD